MRALALVLALLVGCSNEGCGSSQHAQAIKAAELACLKQTAASALAKLAAAQAAGSQAPSKLALAAELTAEELACAVEALAAASGSGSGK